MEKFSNIYLHNQDQNDNVVSIIHWTLVVRKNPQNLGFVDFVNSFLLVRYSLLFDEFPPRVFQQIKNILQLNAYRLIFV